MQEEWLFPNRATPPGSSAYYSVRFAPSGLRDDLAAVLAWRHQLWAILDQVSDPAVARLKLQWWREELERTYAGEPRHPLSKVLLPVAERHALPREVIALFADRVEEEILRRRPPDDKALDDACARDQGALFELLARCHGLDDEDTLASARGLGTFCARVYLVRDSGALLRRGRAVLPADLLRRHGLSDETLARREYRDRLPDLLAQVADRARTDLREAVSTPGLPVNVRVRAVILAALLDELGRTRFDLANQRICLTPLRKLWLAWRESRRH